MRKVYDLKTIGLLEQGNIINGCVARDYLHSDNFGIVITPRCDIENSKVNSIHYLPVVSMESWIKHDFWIIFSHRAKSETKNKIKAIFDKCKLSMSLIDMFSKETLIDKLKVAIPRKADFISFSEYLTKLEICCKQPKECTISEIQQLVAEYSKISKSIFKDLKENKFKEYYLLESWDGENDYFITLMREIGSLEFDFAKKISKGLHAREVSEIDKIKNDIVIANEECFLYTTATLKSPYIEHLVQQFFLNFGRIGVQEHINDLENKFHNSISTFKSL